MGLLLQQRDVAEVTPAGRFLFKTHSRTGREAWALAYRGAHERTTLCKRLLMEQPQLISDAWIDKNKDKFEQNGEEDLQIKKEFANYPYFGITPYAILTRLGISVSCKTKEGTVALVGSGAVPSALAFLAK